MEATCSKGTYIRSLVHDIGEDLGCGAHVTQLERTKVGPFHVDEALREENWTQREIEEEIRKCKTKF